MFKVIFSFKVNSALNLFITFMCLRFPSYNICNDYSYFDIFIFDNSKCFINFYSTIKANYVTERFLDFN
jgi:hypothetical protein